MSTIYDINGNEIDLIANNKMRTINIFGIPYIHFIGTLPTSKDDGALGV